MPASGLWCSVVLIRTDVSEEHLHYQDAKNEPCRQSVSLVTAKFTTGQYGFTLSVLHLIPFRSILVHSVLSMLHAKLARGRILSTWDALCEESVCASHRIFLPSGDFLLFTAYFKSEAIPSVSAVVTKCVVANVIMKIYANCDKIRESLLQQPLCPQTPSGCLNLTVNILLFASGTVISLNFS
jgi:hypothetical protein